jgi:DNA-binding MarR family transcriptional regulator
MADAVDPALSIRAALNRKALADARHRAALARRLGLTENEVLAVQHVARTGELTPGQLATQLHLSSGGTTALVHRRKRAGHITREAHPLDRRSALLRLTPTMEQSATEAWAPLVAELDTLAQELPTGERATVKQFLERVADAAEQDADRLARDAAASATTALAVALPALWA